MKRIFGLDLGTTSIGWAVVNEQEKGETQPSSIVDLGVRVVPLTTDEQNNFEKGKPITTNADRGRKRSMRRNTFRYKMRRRYLMSLLKGAGIITDDAVMAENGKDTTFETYRLRALAAEKEISLEHFARVMLMINKKRGYKSNRKADGDEVDGVALDSKDLALELERKGQTPGQYCYEQLLAGKKRLPQFYPSDLKAEFTAIWNKQKEYYPSLLSDELFGKLIGVQGGQTWSICQKEFHVEGIKSSLKGLELKLSKYLVRVRGLQEQLTLEELTSALQDINKEINATSGYLGDISDRSKELTIRRITVGQYKWLALQNDPNTPLRNKVFYRNDYLDEFDKIWDTQARFHAQLTPALKEKIRKVIFDQRPLKSKKSLLSFCQFEQYPISIEINGQRKTKINGSRVCPKSSPVFQEFKIWQTINNVRVEGRNLTEAQRQELLQIDDVDRNGKPMSNAEKLLRLTATERSRLYELLSYTKKNVTAAEIIKELYAGQDVKINYPEIEGNATLSAMIDKLCAFVNANDDKPFNFKNFAAKYGVKEALRLLDVKLKSLDFTDKFNISMFDVTAEQDPVSVYDAQTEQIEVSAYDEPNLYHLWHLLYSYQGDKSSTGTTSLKKILCKRYGFSDDAANYFCSINFKDDYGNLSAKAMRKILVGLRMGYTYDKACELAGYRHSASSLTREELDNKTYQTQIELLPKNSLRNPVVEKILNQMIHVINQLARSYGRPDEIRIEMARDLRKSAQDREKTTKDIDNAKKENQRVTEILQKEFGLVHVSRNDIIRYRLYEELEGHGYQTLYTDQYITKDILFSKQIEIEHIIPQSVLFDDSFANKTLSTHAENQEKGNRTAIDYIRDTQGEAGAEAYIRKINELLEKGAISKKKAQYLLRSMQENENTDNKFINRDLNDTQYIAKKAREILSMMTPSVVTTVGEITARLREDWGLMNIMQELNYDKYEQAGLIERFTDHDGKPHCRIKDWTKRNDHRHHAMDALTIAFTTPNHVNYISHLNTKEQPNSQAYGLREILTSTVSGKRLFIAPMPNFRAVAREFLSRILVSNKAKNKVVTPHVNKPKGRNAKPQTTLTPRGQLHKETIYGMRRIAVRKLEAVNTKFDEAKILTVAKQAYREALLRRLMEFNGDPKKAFSGKNSIDKKPVYLSDNITTVPDKVMTITYEQVFTIRKAIDPELKIDKVLDERIRQILKARLEEFGNEPKKAFVNLDQNPIWFNKDKGIAIKTVTIKAVNEALPIHDKRDHIGNIITLNNDPVRTDYVQTGNNHHVAIFEDENGILQEHIVSFFEATERSRQGLPIVDRAYNADKGWRFVFTMKRNEYFVFPEKDEQDNVVFNPMEIDLMDPKNRSEISKHLFRVQKLTTRDYVFRHHLETTVSDVDALRNKTWIRITNLEKLRGIVKVRVNHIGQIVAVGEY